MYKPLSEKALKKKYEQAGLSEKAINLLHDYFLCFSNLYGVISIKDAWTVFREYEGIHIVHKKDFIAFSGIVQREQHSYHVLEINEVYRDEDPNNPAERLIVNNQLISSGYYRFVNVYETINSQLDKPWYMPDKNVLFSFKEDRFYITPEGQAVIKFVSNLKSNGIRKNYKHEETGEITDTDGKGVKGKKLSDFKLYTTFEQFAIDYQKKDSLKEKLKIEYATTAADKVLERIKGFILIGSGTIMSPLAEAEHLFNFMLRELGVVLSFESTKKFLKLYNDLNNYSNLWQNRGWSPSELSKEHANQMPGEIVIGLNLQKMIEEGKINLSEFDELKEYGINVIYPPESHHQ